MPSVFLRSRRNLRKNNGLFRAKFRYGVHGEGGPSAAFTWNFAGKHFVGIECSKHSSVGVSCPRFLNEQKVPPPYLVK